MTLPAGPPVAEMIDPGRGDPGGSGRRGGLLYLSATLLSQVFALARYVVLARLLGPQQLGLAAAMTVTAGFFDLISDTGSDRFIIQDRDGDLPAVQRLVQLVLLGRGALVGLGVLIFAVPVAGFYGTPALAVGLATMALSPLIGGLLHLDIRRAQRQHDFRGEAICMIAAESAGLFGAVLAALLSPTFMAVAYGLITRSVVLVICSQLLARRPYRLGWDAVQAPRLARFAAPLMLNGLMLFIVSQGDRVLVGHQLGLTSLGYYSAIILLIYYPSSVLLTYMHALFTPLIAGKRDDPAARDRMSDLLGGQTLLLALAMSAGFALVAPPLVPVLFGARFAQSALLISLVGVLQTTRFMLNWPSTTSLAIGRSDTLMFSNMAHILIFPGAFAGLMMIGGITGIVGGFLAGEVVAAAIALILLNRATGRAMSTGFDRLAALVTGNALVVGWTIVLGRSAEEIWRWPTMVALLIATLGLLGWLARREAVVVAEAVSVVRRVVASSRLRIGRVQILTGKNSM